MRDFLPVLERLEFPKIVERLSRFASSEPARAQLLQLTPSTDKQLVELELQRVTEAKQLIIQEGSIPLDGIKNVLPALRKSAIEKHVLTPKELVEIATTLRTARIVSTFFKKRSLQFPLLWEVQKDLYFDKIIEYNIFQALDEEGVVKDSASKDLRQIRQDIGSSSENLRKHLLTILKRVFEKDFAQEEIVTTRDGRMVIPIKAEHKNHVPGFIHSTSASGATVFIEPAETLDLNNALRELQLREEREIERILGELTEQVRKVVGDIERSLRILSQLDTLAAKAKYSIEILGSAPQLTDERRISLIQARHPVLLQSHRREQVVPLDLELGLTASTLVITGPNAGGKSVALKTVGLLSLCVQAGIHIPAAPETTLCIFDRVFVDIGDDQSIENDLSTFSSHLLRLNEVLRDANHNSLVLIDEIGAGTDPAEGGALGASVLEELTRRKCLTIATTHHGMLKVFAYQTPGMINASMEFDQLHLQPSYRLRMGIPGSSYALELAKRLNIPDHIIRRARQLIGEEKVKLEDLLVELERQTQRYQAELQAVSEERDRLESLVSAYDQRIASLQEELRMIRRKAILEADSIVQGAKAVIERSVREIRETNAERGKVKEVHNIINQLRQSIELLKSNQGVDNLDVITVGDAVRLKTGSEVGEVVAIQGQQAVVLWGNSKLKAKVSELRKESKKEIRHVGPSAASLTVDAGTEIDLRGLLGDEAIPKLQDFLDRAVMNGLHRVDIIHGKGTGALRRRVAEFLKSYPYVKTFRLGEWNEGGSGVTVVELKDES
jgi:DNA mismatch repair protein MutS2